MATQNGTSGDDTLSGTSGEDTIAGNGGNDTISGGDGADTLYGGTGADTVSGGDDNDLIQGDEGDDALYGGAGDDTFNLNDQARNDTIDGGAGQDRVRFTSSQDVSVTVASSGVGSYSQNGGATSGTFRDIEEIETSSGNDTIDASQTSQQVTVISGEGDDTISGGGGDDVIFAGSGDDSVSTGAGQDTVVAGDGNDTIFGGAGSDHLSGEDGNDDIFGGADSDTLYGGAGDDTLSGDASNDQIFGGDGNDALYGGEGNDVLIGGLGNDLIEGGSGNDIVFNGVGSDTVSGGAGDDTLYDGSGDDTLDGGVGDDTFIIDEEGETDDIRGGENAGDRDTLDFASTASTDGVNVVFDGNEQGTYSLNNTITNGTFSQIENIVATAQADTIDARNSAADQEVDLGGGDDDFQGGSGNDTASGGAGADTLSGGGGEDRLAGGAGDDVLTGGAGDDTFAFDRASGNDIITDFDVGDDDADGRYNDQLDVSALQNPDGSPVTAFDVTVVDDGSGNAKLIFPEGENIVLQGVTPAQMSSATQLQAAGIPCFTLGTMIATASGERPIETLQVGDRVFTRDRGFQSIRWIGRRVVKAEGNLAPVTISPSVLVGLKAPLVVSPQHRLLFAGYRAELLFGDAEVLVSAAHLIDGVAVQRKPGGYVTYIHLLFDRHEVIYANGVPTESFHTGSFGMHTIDPAARDELFSIFPELRVNESALGDTARRCLKSVEAQMLRM